MTVQDEIALLLKEEEIKPEAGIRLLLAGQSTMLCEQSEMKDRITAVEDHQQSYPSFYYLMKHHYKIVIPTTIVIMFLFALLLPYLTVENLTQFILRFFNLA